MTAPRLSALIVARNEEARLPKCLSALAFADEIVVVLDRTTDASRSIAEANDAAQSLRRVRSEAGVSYAPDGSMVPKTANLLQQLNGLQGPAFDTAYAYAQLAVVTDAEAQYGAYSQSGQSGPLRRYAQEVFPKTKMQLENAKRIAGGR